MSKKLHHLIQSMTKAEKRSFKLFAGSKNSNYVRLFDALQRMPEYDHKKALQLFPEITPSAKSKMAELLTTTIFHSLQYFHREDVELDMLNKIAFIQLLKQRGNYQLMKEYIKDARELILIKEKYFLLGYLLQIEIDMVRTRFLKTYSFDEYQQLNEELLRISEMANNLSAFRSVTFHQAHYRARYGSKDRIKEYVDLMENAASSLMFSTPDQAKSLLALDQYFGFWFWYYEMKSDLANQAAITLSWQAAYDKLPHRVLLKIVDRYVYLQYLVGCAGADTGNNAMYEGAVRRMSAVRAGTQSLQWDALRLRFSLQSYYYQKTHQFQRLLELEPIYREAIAKYDEFISSEFRIIMLKVLAIGGLLNKDYHKCLDYANIVLNEIPRVMFSVQCHIRTLVILAHIGLGNVILLESLYRSFYHFVNEKGSLTEIEKEIRKLILAIEKSPDQQSIIRSIRKLDTAKFKDDTEYFFVGYFFERFVSIA